jgi:hypothetical protein
MATEVAHIKRREAAPVCPNGRGIFRPATDAELEAGYREAFPEGPKPIATFHADNASDLERAKSLLSPEALNRYFGLAGLGMAQWMADMEQPS